MVYKTTSAVLLSFTLMVQVHAHSKYTGDSSFLVNDTIKKPVTAIVPTVLGKDAISDNTTDDLVESNLLNAENFTIKTKADVRAVFHFLKSTKLRNASRDKRISYRLYFGLAKTFVRMKLYPLAMQCYYQTLQLSGEEIPAKDSNRFHQENDEATYFWDGESGTIPSSIFLNNDSIPADPLSPLNEFEYLHNIDTSAEKYLHQNQASIPVTADALMDSYNDGHQAVAYAIVLHVKQPVPGKRRTFTGLNNVGHFFVTLIKFNTGAPPIARSFGFYPEKENLFSATPLHPASASTLKDDALHDWDEAIGKFISRRRFDKIIRLIDRYNIRSYHLNKNNCTDFGLTAAAIAGVYISNTKGVWPLGKGNNPANAGQSILEGKILNTDTGNKQDLFTSTNNVPVK